MKIKRGFSLIELMVVIAVIGILSGIAVPTYTQHIIKSKRMAAQGTLSLLSHRIERHFTKKSTYKDWDISGETAEGYTLTLKATKFTYIISATPEPNNTQKNDGLLEIDNTGRQYWQNGKSGAWSK